MLPFALCIFRFTIRSFATCMLATPRRFEAKLRWDNECVVFKPYLAGTHENGSMSMLHKVCLVPLKCL